MPLSSKTRIFNSISNLLRDTQIFTFKAWNIFGGDQNEWIVSSGPGILSICPSDVEDWFYKHGSDCSLKVICGEHEFNSEKDRSGDISLIPEITSLSQSVSLNSSGIHLEILSRAILQCTYLSC